MEKLYELARLCEPNRLVLEALIKLQNQKEIGILYNLLYSSIHYSNAEAAKVIYGGYQLKRLSALKAKMYRILIKTAITLDVAKHGESDRLDRILDNARNNIAGRILLGKGERNVAISVYEDSLRKKVTEQSIIYVLDSLRWLCLHYGATRYNKYKLRKFSELESYFSSVKEAESLAIGYYVELKKNQIQSLASPSEIEIEKAKKYAKKLKSIPKVNTRLFLFYKFQVEIISYEYARNFGKMLGLCDKAYRDFSTPDLFSSSSLVIINQIRLWALIQAGDYKECISRGLEDLKRHYKSPINWHSTFHYTLKALLYDRDYLAAVSLMRNGYQTKTYRSLGDDHKEIFQIHLGYIHLIVASGLAGDPEEQRKKLPEFKLGKFLNTVPVFSKDKRGINVSIHLMHIAFLLQRKDYNRIIDRVDSLNQYAYRYLRKDDSFRSNCMIKMVIQMTKADFNPIRTERYTKDLRKQLGTITLAGSGENIEVEMIPFEVLWDIMIRAL